MTKTIPQGKPLAVFNMAAKRYEGSGGFCCQVPPNPA
jgi:hypothetical protein